MRTSSGVRHEGWWFIRGFVENIFLSVESGEFSQDTSVRGGEKGRVGKIQGASSTGEFKGSDRNA
tara:strand:- start:659 stop:853 length:195 start_codon:yes stop_codon:yes gene_type:complete